MTKLQVFIVVLLALWGIGYANTKTKCEVVNALRVQGVPDSDMRDWLCLVQHESEFEYDAVSETFDYGIFQINRGFWCKGGPKYTACWQINTYGCGVPASQCSTVFTDSNIANDAECAAKIKRCNDPPYGTNGFLKWYGWITYCQGDLTANPDYDFSHC